MRELHCNLLFVLAVTVFMNTGGHAKETPPASAAPPSVASSMDLREWLQALAKLNYRDEDLRERVPDGRLAVLYAQLKEEQSILQNLQNLRTMVAGASLICPNQDLI